MIKAQDKMINALMQQQSVTTAAVAAVAKDPTIRKGEATKW